MSITHRTRRAPDGTIVRDETTWTIQVPAGGGRRITRGPAVVLDRDVRLNPRTVKAREVGVQWVFQDGIKVVYLHFLVHTHSPSYRIGP